MNILVTGGCGFIGSNFIRYMLKKYAHIKIINLDKLTYAGNINNLKDIKNDKRYRFIRGDICDKKLVDSVFKKLGEPASSFLEYFQNYIGLTEVIMGVVNKYRNAFFGSIIPVF